AVLARVAALPIETWSYKGEPGRHLGPMAQDFAAAFGLGADDRHIHALDAAGVALAAIQALRRQLEAQAARLVALEGECAALRAELRALPFAGDRRRPGARETATAPIAERRHPRCRRSGHGAEAHGRSRAALDASPGAAAPAEAVRLAEPH